MKLPELLKTNYGAFTDRMTFVVVVTDRMTKTKSKRHEIAALLHDVFAGVTTSQYDQKWRNLKKANKKYVDHQNKTGRGQMEKLDFFDDVDATVGESHSVRRPFTVDTAPARAPSETSTSAAVVESSQPTHLRQQFRARNKQLLWKSTEQSE